MLADVSPIALFFFKNKKYELPYTVLLQGLSYKFLHLKPQHLIELFFLIAASTILSFKNYMFSWQALTHISKSTSVTK